MGTPIRGGLIYKKMSLPSIDPISIFTFGTGKYISNVIIDFSGTYHMQTFSYPDLFVVDAGDLFFKKNIIEPGISKEIAIINDLSLTYGEKIIFLGANLEIEKGDHIAILGPNGFIIFI